MQKPIFITGIGTGIGKTVVSAVLAAAWKADYWKPVQAGEDGGTDRLWISEKLPPGTSIIHPELHVLSKPASPHIAARAEGKRISVAEIVLAKPVTEKPLLVEGAGGLLVPLNENETMADLARALGAGIILVSRNYLGSINHSLLTAAYCKQQNLDVLGWVFNDQYEDYEAEIAGWTGYPIIASIPFAKEIGTEFVITQAARVPPLKSFLS